MNINVLNETSFFDVDKIYILVLKIGGRTDLKEWEIW